MNIFQNPTKAQIKHPCGHLYGMLRNKSYKPIMNEIYFYLFICFKYKLIIIALSMKLKNQKLKGEYYIDSKQITAKKGKKNNESFTPNSLSTSHNHHKYEKYDDAVQKYNDSESITLRQFQSFVKTLKNYCKSKDMSAPQSQLKKGQFSQGLYFYLRQKYRIDGDPIKLSRLQATLRQFLPQRPRSCDRCGQYGKKCNQIQLNYFQSFLPKDIEKLQEKLQVLIKENQLCSKILEDKKARLDQKYTIQELKSILRDQQSTIKLLQQSKAAQQQRKQSKWRKDKSKLQIFIDQDES